MTTLDPGGAQLGHDRREAGPRQARQARDQARAARLLLDGVAGRHRLRRLPHRPGARGHLLQLHELRRLRRVELRRALELREPLQGRPRAGGLRVLVPVRDRRDDPHERDLARDRAGPERQDQGAQLLARRLLRAVRARDPGHRLRVPVPVLELAAEDPRRHPALRRQHPHQPRLGVDGDRGARGLAVLRVRDHHLPVGPADDPGRAVRGGVARRREALAAVHARSPSRSSARSSRSTWC